MLTFVHGEEIVKFLADIFDALFSILDENAERFGQLVFEALVTSVDKEEGGRGGRRKKERKNEIKKERRKEGKKEKKKKRKKKERKEENKMMITKRTGFQSHLAGKSQRTLNDILTDVGLFFFLSGAHHWSSLRAQVQQFPPRARCV